MLFGPMTVLMLAGVVFFLVVGVVMILKALSQASNASGVRACSRCQHENPTRAKFCAHCGRKFA